jgi:prostaglandin-H2 D-isomerase / glutathione transferase
MSKPTLTYFDGPFSWGEECRLALHVGGVDFQDNRIKPDDWPALKPTTPYGSLPLFELPGHPVLGQVNAILVLIGRRHGLHPKDDFEAARHESIMKYVEDLRSHIGPTLLMDEVKKKPACEKLVSTFIPGWGANVEKQIGDGPFFGGAAINVVDLKLYMIVRWLRGGELDLIPPTVLAAFTKINRIHDAVAAHPRVKDWYARTTDHRESYLAASP